MNILSRLDKTEVFCDADDFYQDFAQNYQNQRQFDGLDFKFKIQG